jgi:hypothetical protein
MRVACCALALAYCSCATMRPVDRAALGNGFFIVGIVPFAAGTLGLSMTGGREDAFAAQAASGVAIGVGAASLMTAVLLWGTSEGVRSRWHR